jgi:hypothetical protein
MTSITLDEMSSLLNPAAAEYALHLAATIGAGARATGLARANLAAGREERRAGSAARNIVRWVWCSRERSLMME